MFSQFRHHLSLLNPEERLPQKKYEYVALSRCKTNIKCKATIFNAACVDAVFDVALDCRIKDLKEMYSTEASNPYSDMLYAIDPEKDERPNVIGDGFVPASVLTLVDEEGRQLGDEELLFPKNIGELNPGCYPEFTAQVFIATFEVDMPKLAQHLELGGDSDFRDALKCTQIIRAVLFNHDIMRTSDALNYLGLRNDAGEMEKRRAVEKMLFHVSTNLFKRVMRLLRYEINNGGDYFLFATLSAGVNRFGLDDMVTFFDEHLAHVERSPLENILKPIMEALLKSKRVSEEDIVNQVFKKHLFKFHHGIVSGDGFRDKGWFREHMVREYFEVMDGKITDENYRLAGLSVKTK